VGIMLNQYCDNNKISGNTASSNNYDGIYLRDHCTHNTISGNTANNNTQYGIYLEYWCDNNIISRNSANNNSYGIYLFYEDDNNTISENTVDDNTGHGIYLDSNCDNNTISGNTANNNTQYGIYLDSNCDNNTISGNTVDDNTRHGIHLREYCDNNNIINNTIIRNNLGIMLYQSNYNTISENTLIENGWCILEFECIDNIIENNNCSLDTKLEPIFIDDTATGIDAHNWTWAESQSWCSGSGTWSDPYIIENLNIDGFGVVNCIEIRNSYSYFMINNCTIYNEVTGIMLENTDRGSLISNNCSNNWEGIHLYNGCNNNTILGNTANNNYGGAGIYLDSYCDNNIISGNIANENDDYGIYLYNDCDDNTISGNTANSNSIGLWFYMYCDYNIISGNTINFNDYGVHVTVEIDEGCDNNIISGNSIMFNNLRGITVDMDCDDNLIYLNSFIGNGPNYDWGNNQWDNGTIGNYWDDYGGVDADDDGIGDTPYDVPPTGGNPDNFPIWDDGPHFIIVNSPNPGDIFGATDPSFNVSINFPFFDTSWYTLDNGLTNYTFIGLSGTINQSAWNVCEDGPILIKFFVNNSAGNLGTDEITVVKDVLIPIININFPINNSIFRESPPVYSLSIEEANIVDIWYTIDGGVTNITFTELTGMVNQTLWDALSNGNATIRFYAKDVAGHIGFKDLIVVKEVSYNLYVEITDHSYSLDHFNFTFFIFDESEQGIDSATIQMWWNGIDESIDIQNLGTGIYFMSLDPITIAPGEDPILLNMTISAFGYEDKNFETYIAVDPDTISGKDYNSPSTPSGLILGIVLITSGSVGSLAGLILYLSKRRRSSN